MKEAESQERMAEVTAIRDVPEDDNLGADEITAAFEGLSPDDKLKLGAMETLLRRGTGLTKGDLVHEAVCRALLGRRHCPRKTPFMAFLIMTMKSIVSHARKKHRQTVVAADAPATANAAADDAADPVAAPSPEDELIAQQESAAIQKIYGHFEDDEEAGLVLMGLADGLRGKELREAAGLDQAGLDYTIKRIRTRMRKLYPDGWIS